VAEPRWLGLDLIRLATFAAVIVFHYTHWAWYAPDVPYSAAFWPWSVVESYARALSFGGFVLSALYAFLVGWKKPRFSQNRGTLAALLGAWLGFCLLERAVEPSSIFWVWDIFPLLFVSVIMATVVGGTSLVRATVLGALGLVGVLSWLAWDAGAWPIWQQLPLGWRQALVGDCALDLADWPLLPWMGWVFAAYASGRWVREFPDRLNLTRRESIGWGVILLGVTLTLLLWGSSFYRVRLGPHFACEVFGVSALDFVAHLSWPVFLARLSLDHRIQLRLKESAMVRWVSRLRLSRFFGWAYFTAYLLTAAQHFFTSWSTDPLMSLLAVSVILPMTELTLVAGNRLVERLSPRV